MGRTLTIRLSDELHAAARKAAGAASLNAWVREAIAEKVGRSQVIVEVEGLRARVEELERTLRALQR